MVTLVDRAATSAVSSDASAYCRDLDSGPRSWMGPEKDLLPGERLACLPPFLKPLASSSLSPKTIRQRLDTLWMLGGKIVRDLNEEPSLRERFLPNAFSAMCPRERRLVHPQRFGRRATFLRLDVPQTPPLPLSTPALSPPGYPQIFRRSQLL